MLVIFTLYRLEALGIVTALTRICRGRWIYLFKLPNIFVQIKNCICPNILISLFKLRSYSFDQDLCLCAGEGKQTVVALEETNFSLDTVGLLVATLDIVGHRKPKAAAQHQLPHSGVAKISQAGLAALFSYIWGNVFCLSFLSKVIFCLFCPESCTSTFSMILKSKQKSVAIWW